MIVTCCPSKIHNGVYRHLKELEQFGTFHYDVDDSIPNDADTDIPEKDPKNWSFPK